MLARIALWAPLLTAALLIGGYIYLHEPFARDGSELLQVPLSEEDPELDQVGQLTYLGGLDIPRMGQNIGGLSGLRWDAESRRLLAITDDARWVWIKTWEEKNRLFGIEEIESGPLLGVDGEPLEGKEEGDSESLSRLGDLPWNVGFERDHRVLVYKDGLAAPPLQSQFDPAEWLGELEDNKGLEAVAFSHDGLLLCAERQATPSNANCSVFRNNAGTHAPFSATAPITIDALGGVPTDADALSDSTYVVLFRSYSPTEGSGAAIVSYTPDGDRRELATLRPPLSVDNFEGLAVREEGEQTFLYIVSDDNFSASQRTLLMKFEVRPD